GATGEFGKGAKTLTVMTDARGEAKAQGLKVNRTNGKLPIHVSASYRGLSARTVIMQFNEGGVVGATGSGGGPGGLLGVLVAGGGGPPRGGGVPGPPPKTKTATPPPAQ